MKAYAYVKSNNTKKTNYSPLDQFYLRKPNKMTRKMRPNRLSKGDQYEHLKRVEGGERRTRSNATSLVNQGYAGNAVAVGDGLSLGPPNRPGERRIHRAHKLKVPTPIIVLSLPKSGTNSLFQYFTCGDIYAAHTYGLDATTKKTYRIGARFQKNLRHGLPILTNTEPLNVFTDIGYVNGRNSCFYPSIEALDTIARDYPNATLIVSYRPGWYNSVWNLMGKRWKNWCPMFPNTTEESAWESFYVEHRARIRDLVKKHPTLRHLEFDLTDPTAGQQLEDFTGISQRCWGDCKPTMQCNYKTPVNMTAVQG